MHRNRSMPPACFMLEPRSAMHYFAFMYGWASLSFEKTSSCKLLLPGTHNNHSDCQLLSSALPFSIYTCTVMHPVHFLSRFRFRLFKVLRKVHLELCMLLRYNAQSSPACLIQPCRAGHSSIITGPQSRCRLLCRRSPCSRPRYCAACCISHVSLSALLSQAAALRQDVTTAGTQMLPHKVCANVLPR